MWVNVCVCEIRRWEIQVKPLSLGKSSCKRSKQKQILAATVKHVNIIPQSRNLETEFQRSKYSRYEFQIPWSHWFVIGVGLICGDRYSKPTEYYSNKYQCYCAGFTKLWVLDMCPISFCVSWWGNSSSFKAKPEGKFTGDTVFLTYTFLHCLGNVGAYIYLFHDNEHSLKLTTILEDQSMYALCLLNQAQYDKLLLCFNQMKGDCFYWDHLTLS